MVRTPCRGVSWHCRVECGRQLGILQDPESECELGGSETLWVQQRLIVILHVAIFPIVAECSVKH